MLIEFSIYINSILYKYKYMKKNSKKKVINILTKPKLELGTVSRYNCEPTNKFSDICVPSPNGKYKSETSCMNDCDRNFIFEQIKKSRMGVETHIYNKFINELIDMKLDIYLKGGCVLAIYLMQVIFKKYPNKNEFTKVFTNFLSLNLVKDWDFYGYTKQDITSDYRTKLDNIAIKYKLIPKAKRFILYQYKFPTKIGDERDTLFEINITNKENICDMESVMSLMKIKLTKYNLKYIFMFATAFYNYIKKNDEIDIDIILYILPKLLVIIHSAVDGFFKFKNLCDINGDKDLCNINNNINLSKDMLDLIDTFITTNKLDKNIKQFLICHIKEPKRLYFRLLSKNLPKAEKIHKFLSANNLLLDKHKPNWLLNYELIKKLVKLITIAIHDKIMIEYNNSGIDGVISFLRNVNFKPIRDEFIRFPKIGLDYIKLLLNDLYKQVKSKIKASVLIKLATEKEVEIQNLYNIMIFLNDKKILI